MSKILCFLLILIFLTGCFPFKDSGNTENTTEDNTLALYNWKEYTDLSVLKDFEKETGIKIILYEYETTPMMVGDVRANPGKYDVIIMEGYIVPSMKDLKLIEKLDLNKIQNYKNVKKELIEKPIYDHQGKYSVPHLWGGTKGLVYNDKFVKEHIDSWKVLWDKKYRNKIALMDEPRNLLIPLLKISGYSLNTKEPNELKIAEKNALLLKKNGVILGDTLGNIEKVMSGEIWIAQAFNGDVFYKAGHRKDIKFVLPVEGSDISCDYTCLSCDSKNKEGAYKFINYLLRPDISAKFANNFFYVSPVFGAEKYIDKKILNNPVVYPPADRMKKGEAFMDIGDIENEYNRIFDLMRDK